MRWFWKRPQPWCGTCGHHRADHYPGCLNIGPAPTFAHCDCKQFTTPVGQVLTEPQEGQQ